MFHACLLHSVSLYASIPQNPYVHVYYAMLSILTRCHNAWNTIMM